MKKVEATYFKGSQSIEYTEILKHNEEVLEVRIKRDSYDSQSYAKIVIWSVTEKKWNLVSRIPYSRMSVCKNKVYYGLDVRNGRLFDEAIRYFDEDIKELKRLAKIVLN